MIIKYGKGISDIVSISNITDILTYRKNYCHIITAKEDGLRKTIFYGRDAEIVHKVHDMIFEAFVSGKKVLNLHSIREDLNGMNDDEIRDVTIQDIEDERCYEKEIKQRVKHYAKKRDRAENCLFISALATGMFIVFMILSAIL